MLIRTKYFTGPDHQELRLTYNLSSPLNNFLWFMDRRWRDGWSIKCNPRELRLGSVIIKISRVH